MAHLTTNTAVDDVFATYINRVFVSDLEYQLQHQKFTMKGTLIKGGGANILRFNDFAPPGVSATGVGSGYSNAGQSPITEGSTTANEITGITINPTDVTMAEYGEFLKIGQLYEYAAVEGTRERLRKRLRDGALQSIDSQVRLQAQVTTNRIWADTSQSGGSTTIVSTSTIGAATIMLGRKVLFAGLATGITDVPGHPSGHYAAVITPLQELQIITEVTTSRVYWNNAVVNVPGAEGVGKWINGYIGSIYGVAVYTTQNNATVLNSTAQNQVAFMYADGGVGAASFGQMEPSIILNDVNSPYKNVNSIAWHCYFAAKLIGSARVVTIYSTGT